MSQRPLNRARIAGVLGAALIATVGLAACEDSVSATVTNIVDGDTIDVAYDGAERRVRLLNIDTPEATDPHAPPDCLGPEATAFLEERIPVGTEVRLETDAELQDQYGRYLAGVFVEDTLINAEIARAGLGVAVHFEPNSRFYDEVLVAQEEARSAGRGLYDPTIDCTVPAQFSAVTETSQQVLDAAPAADASLGALRAHESQVAAAVAAVLVLSELLDGDTRPGIAVLSGPDLNKMRGTLTVTSSRLDREAREARRAVGAEENRIAEAREEHRAAREAEREAARQERQRQAEQEERQRRAAEQEQARRAVAEREAQQGRHQSSGSGNSGSSGSAGLSGGAGTSGNSGSPGSSGSSGGSGSSGNSGGSGGTGSSGNSGGTGSSSGYDGYTGCRAYGGNYVPNAIDEQGRPYTKIDCTTKVPIG